MLRYSEQIYSNAEIILIQGKYAERNLCAGMKFVYGIFHAIDKGPCDPQQKNSICSFPRRVSNYLVGADLMLVHFVDGIKFVDLIQVVHFTQSLEGSHQRIVEVYINTWLLHGVTEGHLGSIANVGNVWLVGDTADEDLG